MSRPLESTDHVVVVGAGLAGWRCAEALRREGFTGRLSLVGAEAHPPYDRPPLSKQVLSGTWEPARTELVTTDRLAQLDVTWRAGAAACALDAATGTVGLVDGGEIAGTHVVVATGCRARTLPFSAGERLHTLRTLDDARRLSAEVDELSAGATAVVIGGGFIGAEVATSLHARGLEVVVLEAMVRPLVNVVGEEASTWLEGMATDAGVSLRGNQSVTDVVVTPGGLEVQLADGSAIVAAVVVVGVGAIANTEWLEASGLESRNGLVVDDHLLATQRVGAIGDVARFTWRHGPFVEEVRIEHWQCATDHANALAAVLVRGAELAGPVSMVPYFWSDQYGKKIQMLGHPLASDDVVMVAGSPEEGRWLAMYSRGGIVTGLLGLSQPRALMVSRSLVELHVPRTEAFATRPWEQ
jgi:NADPH-dependent 2,4-dienoyl-CoA reductase/sulfur reductase-like enzyme